MKAQIKEVEYRVNYKTGSHTHYVTYESGRIACYVNNPYEEYAWNDKLPKTVENWLGADETVLAFAGDLITGDSHVERYVRR